MLWCPRLLYRASCDSFELNVVAKPSLRWAWRASMLEKGRMFVGLSDRQGMKTCQNSLPLPVQ